MSRKSKLWSGWESIGLSFLFHIAVTLVAVGVSAFYWTDLVKTPAIEIELVETPAAPMSGGKTEGSTEENPVSSFTPKTVTSSLFSKETSPSSQVSGEVLANNGDSSSSYGVEAGGTSRGGSSGGSAGTDGDGGSGNSGEAGAKNQGQGAAQVNWKGRFVQVVEQNKIFPKDARREGVTGVVQLKVVISSNGNLVTNEVRRSSGDSRLDRAAQVAVKASVPFYHDLTGNLDMILSIRFQLAG